MAYGLVLVVFNTMLQLLWLRDLEIFLVDWSLYFMMSRINVKSNLAHSWFDMWGISKAFICIKDLIFLLTAPDHG